MNIFLQIKYSEYYRMYVIILIGIFAYMISKITFIYSDLDIVHELIKETHKYSGINETHYKAFLANIGLAKEYKAHVDRSQTFLHNALMHLNEIPMFLENSEQEHADEITKISNRLGIEFERVLMNEAIHRKLKFIPKYI